MGPAHALAAGARARSSAERMVGGYGVRLRLELEPRVSGVAIVTGAAKGIGAACVAAFLDAGWSVVAVDRDKVDGKLIGVAGDVSEHATNAEAVRTALERF